MNRQTLAQMCCFGILVCLVAALGCTEQSSSPIVSVNTVVSTGDFAFESPVRFTTVDGAVRVQAPGYAAPCWADIDLDGSKELLVGQFNGGKIRVFKSLGGEKLDEGEWLQAGGSVAEVPGVW